MMQKDHLCKCICMYFYTYIYIFLFVHHVFLQQDGFTKTFQTSTTKVMYFMRFCFRTNWGFQIHQKDEHKSAGLHDSIGTSPRRSWLKMMRPMLQKRIRRTHHGSMMGESSMEYLCDYFPMLIIARDEIYVRYEAGICV